MRSLFTAASGMEAQQLRIDAIANNLANVTTTGFKKSRPEFQDLFYEVLQAPGASSADGSSLPIGAQIGHGVRNAGISQETRCQQMPVSIITIARIVRCCSNQKPEIAACIVRMAM